MEFGIFFRKSNNESKVYKTRCSTLILSVISIVLSLGSIGYMSYKGCCFSIQSINFGDASVTVLCAITAILIGWNIYRVIEDKDKIKKEVLEEVNKELAKSQYKFYNSFITEEITLANIYMNLNDWENALPFLSLMGKRYKWIANDYNKDVDFSSYIGTVASFIDKIDGNFIHNSKLKGFMDGVFYDLAQYNKKVVDAYKTYKDKFDKARKETPLMGAAK